MDLTDEPEQDDSEHRFSVTDDGKLEENEDAEANFEENLTFDD